MNTAKKTSATTSKNENARNSAERPTVQELALVAATIAGCTGLDLHAARPPEEVLHDLNALSLTAFNLWTSAARRLKIEQQWEVACDVLDAMFAGLPMPKSYPVTRDEFIRLVLPRLKGRTAEQAAALKGFAKHQVELKIMLETGTRREAAPEEIANYYATWNPSLTEEEFTNLRRYFLFWWEVHHAVQVTLARRKARKSRKKPLTA